MDKSLADVIAKEWSYRNKILVSIAATELLLLGIFTLWPVDKEEKAYQDMVFTEQNVMVEEVQITTQKSSPPPPPKPQVPVPVPDDEVVEEELMNLEEMDISEYSDSLEIRGMGRIGDADQVVSNPQQPPSLVRIVEPTIPQAARQADIKAEILVSFLVNKRGNVEEATISQVKLYEKGKDEYRLVKSIDYGLTDATLEAALQWKFRPAKHNGQAVKAYTSHYFSIGF